MDEQICASNAQTYTTLRCVSQFFSCRICTYFTEFGTLIQSGRPRFGRRNSEAVRQAFRDAWLAALKKQKYLNRTRVDGFPK